MKKLQAYKKQWSFSFLEKDRNTIDQDFSLPAASQSPSCILHWSRLVERKQGQGYLLC